MTAFLTYWTICAIAQTTAIILAGLAYRESLVSALVIAIIFAPVAFITLPISMGITLYADIMREKGKRE